MKTIGWICSYVIAAILLSIWAGYALSVVWGWFIVPVFDLPEISIPYAIGISLVVSFLTKSVHKIKDGELKESFLHDLSTGAIRPALLLLIGAIVKGFV